MAFSFSNWFKKPGSGEDESSQPADQPPVPAAEGLPLTLPNAPSSPGVRQTQPVGRPAIRTAMPNSMQPVNLRDSTQRPPVPLGNRPLTATAADTNRVPSSMPTARKIAFGGPAGAPPMMTPSIPTLSPSRASSAPVAPPMTMPEFTVALQVNDFIDRIPPGLLQPGNHPQDETVEFSSTELYSDLAKGRASVPASVIYAKCPSLFARAITEMEDAEVQLPLPKIVAQMSAALQTRPDQVHEETGAEIETPFLNVAKEDNARLPKATGTTIGALPGAAGARPQAPISGELPASVSRAGMRRTGQISSISPIKAPADPTPPLAPPSASTTSAINPGKRPPSTVRASVAGGKIRLSGPATPPRSIVPIPVQPGVSPGAMPVVPNPDTASSSPNPIPSAGSPSHQVAKKTARIQIPPISLRNAGAPGATGPRPPVAFTPPAAPAGPAQPPPFRAVPPNEPQMPNFRPAPPAATPGSMNFRSSPPPPPATKRLPSSFALSGRPPFPPPSFPAVPPIAANGSLPAPDQAPSAAPNDQKIELGLAAILRGLPSSSLTVSPSSIPDDQRISLPFAPIEAQLSKGRISVPKSVFIEALPADHQGVLAEDLDLDEIPIPLQEVFQNLPNNALSIRADQVIEETTHIYPTPFSQKADEDAARLGLVEAVKPFAGPTEEPVGTPEAPAAILHAPEISEPELAEEPIAEEPVEGIVENEESDDHSESSPEVDVHHEHTAEPTAKLVDTEEASVETNHGLAVEPAAVETVADGSFSVGEFSPVAPTAPSEDSPVSTAVDRAEIEAVQTEHTAEPIEIQSLAEPPSVSPEESILDHGGQAPFADEEPVVLAPLDLPVVPADEPVFASEQSAHVSAVEEPGVEQSAPSFPAPQSAEPAYGTDEISSADVPVASIPVSAAVQPSAKAASVSPQDSILQTLFMTEDEMDAKTIVKYVSQLPGIKGCAVMFGDGLPLAGNFPEGNEKAGFSAMAPPFFKRTLTFTEELNLGSLEALTLHTEHGMLSFFMQNDICMSVRHGGRGFLPGVREKLDTVTRELAKIYSSEKPAHSQASESGR